jgi:hypothetical protein
LLPEQFAPRKKETKMKDIRRGVFMALVLSLFSITAACGSPVTHTLSPPDAPNPTRTLKMETASVPATADPELALEDISTAQFDDPISIDNPYFPLIPGTQFVYEGFTIEFGKKVPHSITYTVTDLTKEIAGVQTIVAWVLDYTNGKLVEAEVAFYAQDNDGNIWYMGEYPEAYEDGKMVEAPAWIPGLKGAKAGIAMKADPRLNQPSYSQGWGPAVDWTDRGRVVRLGEHTCVPTGCYDNVLVTEEFSRSEANAFQVKYFAPGVGNIKVEWRGQDTAQEELQLTKLVQLSPEELVKVRSQALAHEERAYKTSKEVYDQTLPMKTGW